jgi:uncharacterized membrane protein
MNWSFATNWLLIAAGMLIWSVAAGMSWQNFERRRTRAAALLETLRMAIVTALIFTLFRPEIVRTIERAESPEIAVLLDASGSMLTVDTRGTSNVISRADWITQHRATNLWAGPAEVGEVLFDEFSPASTRDDPDAGTDIASALEDALRRYRHLRAVVMLTDGDWNLGGSPMAVATRFREQDIPIFGIGVGAETALPDLSLEKVATPSYGLIGEQIALPFKVHSHLDREVSTTLVVRAGERIVARKDIVIPARGQLQDAVLWSPRETGEIELTLSLPKEEDEVFPENNELPLRINIRAETLKVLVVDSLPRWEYRYLRNALMRDPGVEMHSVLLHPDLGPGEGLNYLKAFPGAKDQLALYDVVFIGDVGLGEGELQRSDLENLKGLVEQQASGLVFLPGRRGRQSSFAKTPLADLMPVILDPKQTRGIGLQSEVPLLLSTLGKGHWLTRFDADEDRNAEIWKNLPGFAWSAAVEKSRPGSEVLAVHASMRNAWGRIPLLVTRSAGAGKVLFMGTDSAWRWRRGVEDKFHYRFWSQVVRWMAHQRHLADKEGIRLTHSPESPNVGDTIFLQSTVLDGGGFPMERGNVSARITGPDGRVEDVAFEALEGGWGVFKSRFTPRVGGEFKIKVEAPTANRTLETTLNISQPVREKPGQPANFTTLGELARITGGEAGTITDFERILEAVKLLPDPRPTELRFRLWSDPWWGAFLLLLLAIYWTGRKLAGMV